MNYFALFKLVPTHATEKKANFVPYSELSSIRFCNVNLIT